MMSDWLVYATASLGALIGLLGGAVGTWFSIRNTQSAEERAFVARAALLLWVALLVCGGLPMVMALLGFWPFWVLSITMSVVWIGLGPFILWANRRQAAVRRRQAEAAREGSADES